MTHILPPPKRAAKAHLAKKVDVEFKRVQNIQPNKEQKKNQKDQNKTASAKKETTPAIFLSKCKQSKKRRGKKIPHLQKRPAQD
jgi:hypothetical protein